MMHKDVEREFFGRLQRAGTSNRSSDIHISKRQIIVLLLMIIILGSWALDSLKVSVIPHSLHQRVANTIDYECNSWPTSAVLPNVDTTVAHNPLDDSPVTFGSVILLGIVCAVGLTALAITSVQQKAN